MRLKTLLLGSAAAFAFAGGSAQAADLSVAEPVDYVRVCDAFGAGYWYIPGTDTCVAIGGEVEFRVYFHEDQSVDGITGHTGSWQFRTSFDLNVTTKSMTDWGPLTTFINLTAASDNTDGDSNYNVTADEFYISLGPVLVGITGSAFDGGAGYTWNAGDFGMPDLSDQKIDQVQLSWAINGFGLILAVEDGRDRWGSSSTNDFPDLVAAITASGTGWDAKVAFLYADLDDDSLMAVLGDLEFEIWGDQLLLSAMWADDGNNFSNGLPNGGLVVNEGYAVQVSYQHNWSSNLYSAASLQYFDDDDIGDGYRAAFTTAFSPADNLWTGFDIQYVDNDADNAGDTGWWVTLFAERKFGP